MEEKARVSRSGSRRRSSMSAAASPAPLDLGFDSCGHDGCEGGRCKVSYVGPVSYVRDHHAMHAARGVTHVWTAAIVSGLAVVLTSVIAYNVVQARVPAVRQNPGIDASAIMKRLDKMERAIHEVAQRCNPNDEQDESAVDESTTDESDAQTQVSPPRGRPSSPAAVPGQGSSSNPQQ